MKSNLVRTNYELQFRLTVVSHLNYFTSVIKIRFTYLNMNLFGANGDDLEFIC